MIVSKAQFADIIGCSPRQIGRLIDQGMPATRKGRSGVQVQIDSAEAIRWITDRAIAEELGAAGARTENVTPLSADRRTLIQEQARRLKIRNDLEAGKVIDAEEVEAFVSGVASLFIRQLDALSGRLAQGDAIERARIRTEVARIRTETADELQRFAEESSAACA